MKKIPQITPEEIQNILKKVNYPGFSRDIVSFGMVKEILIQDKHINISLQINSGNEDIINQLKTVIYVVGENYWDVFARTLDTQIFS